MAEDNREYLEELYADLDTKKLLKILIDKTLENIQLQKQCTLYGVGSSFIHELIKKETDVRTKLSENLDLYKDRNNMQMYERTFDLWNKQNLVLWDLKDILCRMGKDID